MHFAMQYEKTSMLCSPVWQDVYFAQCSMTRHVTHTAPHVTHTAPQVIHTATHVTHTATHVTHTATHVTHTATNDKISECITGFYGFLILGI